MKKVFLLGIVFFVLTGCAMTKNSQTGTSRAGAPKTGMHKFLENIGLDWFNF